MLYRILQDKFTKQQNFLEDQFIFEKIVLEKIVNSCQRHNSEQQFDECAHKYR